MSPNACPLATTSAPTLRSGLPARDFAALTTTTIKTKITTG